jgi:hypothetical protein
MGLIKKYQAGSKMNYSFDNNNNKQQKLVKKQYDKNAAGVDSNASMYGANMYADENFKPKEFEFNSNQKADFNNQQGKAGAGLAANASSIKLKSVENADGSMSKKVDGSINGAAMAGAAMQGYSDYQAVKNDPNSTMQQRMDQTSNSVSGTVGAANPVIGTIIGAGNMIGKPIQAKAEARNEDGSFKNYKKANNTAYAGVAFDGMQAFAARKELAASGDKSAWYTLDMNKYTKLKEKQGTDAYKKLQEENAKIAKDKDIYLKKARDQQSAANLYNSNGSGIYKKGGKLVPRFRRGGELDLEKENVILDGPSHDDHNKTGVKGDKGLPVVNKGTKVAEIESLELILNKNSSVKLENLAKEYKKTGDVKILNKIGEVMKKEINDNTYDYSKEIL